jgi:hypothetical protein
MCSLENNVMDLDNERIMTRYLLGDPTLADRAPIEDGLSRDALYFEALCALEDEVILKWHRGELSDDECRLFTLAYLSSPTRHARVESTRALIDAIDGARAAQHVSIWIRMRRWFVTPRQVPQFAIAALAAILVAAVGFAVYRMNGVTGQLTRGERESVELRQQTGAAHTLAVAFTLSPVGERSQDTERTNVVRVPRQAAEVWLQFQIADPGTATEFDAVLDPLDRTHAATPRPARVERVAAAALVTVTLAPADLPDGDYVLSLRRTVAASGVSPDIVATRTLRVIHE